tara:strand:- start:1060 stop:1329 length:270 start_codon:yes stop_codon:yes gene_type:complete
MNGQKAKRIRRHAKELMLNWIKSVVDEDEAKKVTLKNLAQYVPNQTHIYANQQLRVSAYTLRWFEQGIKKLLKKDRTITSITVQDLEHD